MPECSMENFGQIKAINNSQKVTKKCIKNHYTTELNQTRNTLQVCNTHSSSTNISFQIWHHNHPCIWAWISNMFKRYLNCNHESHSVQLQLVAIKILIGQCRYNVHGFMALWLHGFNGCVLMTHVQEWLWGQIWKEMFVLLLCVLHTPCNVLLLRLSSGAEL